MQTRTAQEEVTMQTRTAQDEVTMQTRTAQEVQEIVSEDGAETNTNKHASLKLLQTSFRKGFHLSAMFCNCLLYHCDEL
jgi:hypothetical protein